VAGKPRFGLVSKALSIAVVEAVILILIYGGLVREYASNVNMQNWVQANFALGSYSLNYKAVLVLAGLLGVLIFQLLPRNFDRASFRASSGRDRGTTESKLVLRTGTKNTLCLE